MGAHLELDPAQRDPEHRPRGGPPKCLRARLGGPGELLSCFLTRLELATGSCKRIGWSRRQRAGRRKAGGVGGWASHLSVWTMGMLGCSLPRWLRQPYFSRIARHFPAGVCLCSARSSWQQLKAKKEKLARLSVLSRAEPWCFPGGRTGLSDACKAGQGESQGGPESPGN